MLTLDDARARRDALAALHSTAIDACRRAADACAHLMLRGMGDNADAHVRLAMDAVEIFGTTAGVLTRRSPNSLCALAACETVAPGCAKAFERDAAGDTTAQACRECVRACCALRTSVAPVRMHGAAA